LFVLQTNRTHPPFFIIQHLYPLEYEGHFTRLMINAKDIRSRVRELAQLINQDYVGKRPVLICTLKGACLFFVHLSDALQELRQGYDIEFVRASSYEGTSSTGVVKMMGELNLEALRDRHVLIIEDIVDTGATLAAIVPFLKHHGNPTTTEVCTLLDKRLDHPGSKKYSAKYCGFSIPNFFIVGYG
jgi:hypoxanthine phosphoribosyltransferase